MTVRAGHAAAELLRRRRARESLSEYARSIEIPGAPANDDLENEIFRPVETSLAPHHILITEAIQRTVDPAHPDYRPNGRLMIFAPPGSAKSSYASVVAPAWMLSKWPGYRIILASHGGHIAEQQSSKVRAIARDPTHISIWEDKPTLAKDQRAKGQWSLSNGSEFKAAGIMSGITGARADGVVIDDPVSGKEEADSQRIRDKTYQEYKASLDTRLRPNGWIILIQTRWHQDDLAGRILPEDYKGQSGWIRCRDGQEWFIINLPAEAEHPDDPLGRQPGEFLWPEWFPEQHWLIRKNDPTAKAVWNSLYQQRPGDEEGVEFKRHWFRWYDPDLAPGAPGGPPEKMTTYGATDLASAKPENGQKRDFTEHGVIGVAPNFDWYFLDWWYGQEDPETHVKAWEALVRRYSPRRWWDEGGPIGATLNSMFKQRMREGRFFVTRDSIPSNKNKQVKLQPFQLRASMGTIYLPLNRPWANRLVDQLCIFPNGTHDDAADVCGLLARGIDKMMNPVVSSPPERKSLEPFTWEWLTYEEPERPRIRYT